MADTPDHTDELREVAGTRSQGLKSTLDQQVTMLESRDVIGADVYGVDLSQPLSPAAFATLETAFHTRAVLCLRQQRVTAQQFIDFAHRLVAYLLGADNSISPLLSRLRGTQQPVIRSRNGLSAPWAALLSCL